jgi:hypothetical protein
MYYKVKLYLRNHLLVRDLTLNVWLGGSPYEPLSSRVWRNRDKRGMCYLMVAIDWFFGTDHCLNSAKRADYYEGYEVIR